MKIEKTLNDPNLIDPSHDEAKCKDNVKLKQADN